MLRDRFPGKALFLAGGITALVVFAGCGSSTPRPDAARLAQLVAETNAVCGSIAHRAHASPAQQRETQHRLAVLAKALSHAAAYLPAGRSLDEAHAKRRALEAKTSKLGQPDYVDRFYRLQLQIYDDYKALGLTPCVVLPPRPPISG